MSDYDTDLWDGPRFEVWDDFLHQIEEDGWADQWSFDFDRCPDYDDPAVLAANKVAAVAEQRVIVRRDLWDQPPPKWQLRRWGLPIRPTAPQEEAP